MTPFTEILAVGALGLLVLAMFGVTRIRVRSFWCPIRGRTVTAHFRQAIFGGRLMDVERCSAFRPETAVTCAKGCLNTESEAASRARA